MATATATTINIAPSSPAVIRVPTIAPPAANKISSLLQQNHETHHITFDESFRHNHIVHHLLASFSLGADPETLQKQYDHNSNYQRPPPPADEDIISSLSDPEAFQAQTTKPQNYTNFLTFFTRRLSSSSIPDVLNEYVFATTDLARTIFNRFFAGYYHPFIHLGCGIEFDQPAIVAEALAQACVHPAHLDEFFNAIAEASKTATPAPQIHLVRSIRADEKMLTAAKWDDGRKFHGLLIRARDETIAYASQWQVLLPPPPPSDADSLQTYLEEKAAEVTNTAAFIVGAAQNPPKVVKMDFLGMHAVTSTIFLNLLVRQPWLSDQNKAKLIEWKGRLDLTLYASLGSPKLLLDEIRDYPTNGAEVRDWEDMIREAAVYMDDGHTVKFIRALKNGEEVCRAFERGRDAGSALQTNGSNTDERWTIRDDMWQRLAMMVLDSVQPEKGERWARSVGFNEAWEKYPARSSSKALKL